MRISDVLNTCCLGLLLLGLALGAPAVVHAAADGKGRPGDAAPPPRFDPDATPVPFATLAARQKFFGAENVDPRTGAVPRGEVHLSWVTVTTFAAALDGHVVLFDTYIHKGEDEENYVPATVQDLVDLQPEYIILGHGHFDHAAGAGEIAGQTGAVIVGTEQHCNEHIVARGLSPDQYCRIVYGAGDPFGKTAEVKLWDGICTTTVLHPHSQEQLPDPGHPVQYNVILPVPDPNSPLIHPPGPTMIDGLTASGDEGGVIVYQFRIGNFSMVYHDSSGPLPEVAPQVYDALQALPPTDVQVGAIIGFNQVTNGMRDPGMYAAAINAKVFIPTHHDFIFEYGSSQTLQAALRQEFEFYGANPELRFIQDPYDYVRPNLLRFDLDSPRWIDADETACPAPGSGSRKGPKKGSG